ncbi:MAG: hypothetical protein LBU47_07180 [Christensenellaceae bacterium]|jgi:hypothetical protein|nr:hypothetical protein [Christensenellaceae bacterium]
MKTLRKLGCLGLLLCLPLLLSACLPGIGGYSESSPAGFFNGVWHGWLAPFSLIMQAFGAPLHMYEAANTGLSYDIGFYMAVISGFGGLALVRRKKKR